MLQLIIVKELVIEMLRSCTLVVDHTELAKQVRTAALKSSNERTLAAFAMLDMASSAGPALNCVDFVNCASC